MSERFFIENPISFEVDAKIELAGQEAKHMFRVLRKSKGDIVTLFDGHGYEFRAEIVSAGKTSVELRLLGAVETNRELPFHFHIYSAIPKGRLADLALQQLCELGVSSFTALITERSVVKPREAAIEGWRRLVIESSKQNGRNTLMEIHDPLLFKNIADSVSESALRILLQPGKREITQVLTAETVSNTTEVVVCIGPEGGFSNNELQIASSAGFEIAGFGASILRISTAATAVTGLLRGLWEKV